MLDVVNSLVSQALAGTPGNQVSEQNLRGGPVQYLPQNPTVDLYQRTLGRTPSQAEIDSWNFGSTIDPQELDRFLGAARNEAITTMPTTGAVGNIANQILSQSNPAQLSGTGLGTAEKTAYDMAVMLAGQGISDVNQLGKATKEVPTYDEEGNQVGTQSVTQFINKATGEAINPYYDKASQVGPDIWGGTFAGKGSTGYGVNFDASGNPNFYSQYGGSSSNLKDYAPLLAIGGLALGAPYLGELLGGASAGAGTTLASLGDLGTMGALGGEGALAGGAGTVAGMGTGTGLTSSGLGGLGGLSGAAGFDGALGSGLTSAGAGGLGGALGAAGFDGALGSGLTAGAGGLAATNSLLGGSALGSTLGNLATGVGAGALGSTLGGLSTGVGSGLGSAAGSAAGTALGSGAGSALGTSLATGLGLSALGNVLGTAANQSGISNARDLINQYGAQAQGNLAKAYADAQALNAANKADLTSNYAKTQGQLGDVYKQQVGFQQPYQQVGQSAAQGLIANQPYFTHQFDVNDLYTNLAPNYAFQLQQGQMANQRAANMGGGVLGGNALQGLQRYTQDYAGNAYQNAFNNYNTQRNNIYNSLAGMANIGTTSAGQLAGLGNTYGSNLGSLSSNYGGNLTTAAGQGINAANAYGLNTANLATGIGSALAGNATATGANTANALNTLGNTALLGSMIKAT